MSNKKLLIHVPKNGGMSIRHSPMLKDKIMTAKRETHMDGHADAVKKVMDGLGDHHGWEHARWRDIRTDITDKHTAFAILRNPWDRVVSRYFFAKKVIEVEKKVPPSYADVSSFEAFLEERHKWGEQLYMWHRAIRGWFPAMEHITDFTGEIRCDILRFENYNEDVCRYFDIPEMSKARNVTGLNKGSYMDMYDAKTRQIVADWYERDIEAFGFDFDTGAQRNYYFEGK